jgi:hypothetical protein
LIHTSLFTLLWLTVSTCFGHYLPILRRHYTNAGLVTVVCSCRCGLVSGCGNINLQTVCQTLHHIWRGDDIKSQALHVQRNIETISLNHCCREETTSITYSECVSVALGIYHAMCIIRTIFSSMAGLILPYFFRLSHKLRDYWEKRYRNINFVFWFSLQFFVEIFLIQIRI